MVPSMAQRSTTVAPVCEVRMSVERLMKKTREQTWNRLKFDRVKAVGGPVFDIDEIRLDFGVW